MPNPIGKKEILSDADLYLLIKENAKAGFDYLYAKYSSILYGLAIKTVHSKEYASEIIELTFSKIWKDIDFFVKQKCSMSSWILQNLFYTMQEFLTSKNITYNFKTDRLYGFRFELSQKNEDLYNVQDANNMILQIL